MLSENFRKLLEIQMERYDAILKDCDPFTSSAHDGDAALHQRIVKDVRDLKNLTEEFMEAAQKAQTNDEKSVALKLFSQTSFISSYLWDHLYLNMDQASPFRKAALGQHAAIMDTLRKEHVTTNVTLGWELVESILGTANPKDSASEENAKHGGALSPQQERGQPKPKGSHLRLVKK